MKQIIIIFLSTLIISCKIESYVWESRLTTNDVLLGITVHPVFFLNKTYTGNCIKFTTDYTKIFTKEYKIMEYVNPNFCEKR